MASTTIIELNVERQQELLGLTEPQPENAAKAAASPTPQGNQPAPPTSPNRQEAAEEQENTAAKKSGTLQVEDFYRFDHFNQSGEYKSVKKWHNLRSEFVFEHKEDHTKIDVRKHKIVFDNTDRNYAAALDLAQDKGWKSINIKGKDREAKAEIWFMAQMRGLETTGYEPTRADKQRLAGALEARKAEGLDIKPQSAAQSQDRKAAEVQSPEKSAEKAPAARAEKSAETPAAANVAAASKKEQGQVNVATEPSQAEIVQSVMKEMAIEAGRVLDLDDKQITVLENVLNKGVAQAAADGKPIDVKTLADKVKTVKSKLPTIRNDVTQAAKMEQSMAKDREQAAEAAKKTRRQPTRKQTPQKEIGGPTL